MEWFPWLRPPFEQLIDQYRAGRGHHALLVCALPAMGQETLVYALSRWLMCQHPQAYKSCGQCHSCQLMQAGSHPDSYHIDLLKGKSTIGIDAVRDVLEKLYRHAQQGGNKVVILSQVEHLTEAAANALLKTLEEPPANTWFFLTSGETARIPATLRSRCLSWHLSPPEEGYALNWLAAKCTQDKAALSAALRMAGGSPGAAQRLLQPDAWQQREKLFNTLDTALSLGDLLPLLGCLSQDDGGTGIHWLCTLLMDALKFQQGAMPWLVNGDSITLVEKLAHSATRMQLLAVLDSWVRCREGLLNIAGVNRELLVTEQLLNWEKLTQPGATVPSHLL